MTTITPGQQSVSLTVADGPVLQYNGATITTLTDDGVTANDWVTLDITSSLSSVSFSLKHSTGPGANFQIQPTGAWTLDLNASIASGSQPIQGGGTGVQQLQLSSEGVLQYKDANGDWQPLTSTTLTAASFAIYNNDKTATLTVAATSTIATTATIGVAAANAGNAKSLSLTVTSGSVPHDPTFVIKSKVSDTGGR